MAYTKDLEEKAQTASGRSGPERTLDIPVQYAKGVGPRFAKMLEKLGVFSVRDLLTHYPKRHEDRTKFARVSELEHGEPALVCGSVLSVDNMKTRGTLVLTKVAIDDGSGVVMLTWFNQPYRREQFLKLKGRMIVAYGTVQLNRWGPEIGSPDWEIFAESEESAAHSRLVPVYSLTDGLFQTQMRSIALHVLDGYAELVEETLPKPLRDRLQLMGAVDAVRNIHFPESKDNLEAARKRLVFEELFLLQLALAIRKQGMELPGEGIAFTIPDTFAQDVKQVLPFEMTDAQKRVTQEILGDMRKPTCMNRLLQGDVGSGKTAVAVAAMMVAVRNGYQAALMAPTEILAEQHYLAMSEMFGNLDMLGLTTDLLTGSLKAKQKREVLERIASGETRVIIGTHALIQEGVAFHKLGLVIVDEQHRFGVLQRAALMEKGQHPDILVMTATPIPRTLTLTLYGDLDVSIIDQMPPGRKPIKTHWKQIGERKKVYKALRTLIDDGKQAYVVCPLIEESEKLQVRAATDLAEELQHELFPDLKVGLLHGQMKTEERDAAMKAFRHREMDILVATTVIEIGVDVPNAVCMIVEDADRFGLAQLHQLRGRVGRGSDQSFCVLICEANSDEAARRMQTMADSNDGFVIAEEDLKLRGPGEFYGTRQSGMPSFEIADVFRDIPILELARKEAFEIVSKDRALTAPEYKVLKKRLLAKYESFQLAVVS